VRSFDGVFSFLPCTESKVHMEPEPAQGEAHLASMLSQLECPLPTMSSTFFVPASVWSCYCQFAGKFRCVRVKLGLTVKSTISLAHNEIMSYRLYCAH
jgi:hypothetical protein